MLITLIACAAGADTSIDDTGTTTTQASAPTVAVWEYICGEDAPEWTMPSGTIIGLQHVRYLNVTVGVLTGETVTVSPDEATPLVNGSNPAETCGAEWIGGRVVVTFIP